MNPDLLTLAYDTINETYTFPMLFNDDVIIDGIAEAYDVSVEAAYDYYPLGCGEVVLAPHSPGILCVAWDIPKAVDKAIRKSNAKSYDELYAAFVGEIKSEAAIFAGYHRLLVDTHNKNSAFLMSSLLTNDCIKNNKPLLDGGARYLGGVVMGHGFTNAADALSAIKKVVYDDKAFTLAEIVKALDADFDGCENIRKALLSVPKYGNDDTAADTTVSDLWRDISVETKQAGKDFGFDFFTVSSVNPGGYGMGQKMGATADGRQKGQPYAIGNAPTAGNDKSGITALMNSILRTNPANGGTMTNFKVSRDFFTKERAKFEALFSAYWVEGGQQANVAIVNKGDLEAALKEPEKYPHLLVRLGGWTARFIDLENHIQREILNRTLY
jgi:pyruvate-formate lyase